MSQDKKEKPDPKESKPVTKPFVSPAENKLSVVDSTANKPDVTVKQPVPEQKPTQAESSQPVEKPVIVPAPEKESPEQRLQKIENLCHDIMFNGLINLPRHEAHPIATKMVDESGEYLLKMTQYFSYLERHKLCMQLIQKYDLT